MFEHRHHHLLAWPTFLRRAFAHVLLAIGILGVAVSLGTIGYHLTGHLPWLDSFLNASMILSGMGPVDRMDSSAAKALMVSMTSYISCS